MAKTRFPHGKRFAFTICDDTDMARVETVMPIYRLLEDFGMRAAKSVWPLRGDSDQSIFARSQTLEDAEYRDFVVDLGRRGFEITMHGAAMATSPREDVIAALARYHTTFGAHPRVHTNHAHNRDNLYWGAGRVDDPVLRRFYVRLNGMPEDHFLGHVENSPYWWGDLCQSHVTYVRNLTFNEINLDRVNPSMPYHDPSRSLVRRWFSATDADSVAEFNQLIASEQQERLEQEGGVCIVATHFGKKFVEAGRVNPLTRELLAELASRPGWFPNLSELLDHLRAERRTETLPRDEWKRMQWVWGRGLLKRKWEEHRQRTKLRRARKRAQQVK
jgi:hypothetical protein